MAAPLLSGTLTLPLNRESLQLPYFQKTSDGDHSVQRFVNEQRTYVRRYAQNGALTSAEWINANINEAEDKEVPGAQLRATHMQRTLVRSEEAAMFSSPVLQPRVPVGPTPEFQKHVKEISLKQGQRNFAHPSMPSTALPKNGNYTDKKAEELHASPEGMYLNEHEARQYAHARFSLS